MDYVRLPDPDLEPGFPVQTFHAGGVYSGTPGVHTLVGDIDNDFHLEIVVSGLGSGYLYAWNHDGTSLPGWPVMAYVGASYPVLGELSAATPGVEVFTGHMLSHGVLVALDEDGLPLAGWPRSISNYVSNPGSAFDLDNDGLDELFICEEDAQVHQYRADGSVPSGWPVRYMPLPASQNCFTPALGDLDQDGIPEIITVPGGAQVLLALRRDGTHAPGFPYVYSPGGPNFHSVTLPALGDVDGNGVLDIVVVGWAQLQQSVLIFSGGGRVMRTFPIPESVSYGTAPALADLDDDGLPEIVVQTDTTLSVLRADGSAFPGWPRAWTLTGLGNAAPVVGDVTGDGRPDIVVVSADPYGNGEVRVFDVHGNLEPRFAPNVLPLGQGATPAIADFDLDGRNELIITGAFWNGFPGYYDKVWAYDLGGGPHGAIHWGQYMAESSHRGVYPLGLTPRGIDIDDGLGGDGNHVLEPGEHAIVATRWRNMGTFTRPLSGTITEFTGPNPRPRRYTLIDPSADHGPVREGEWTDCVAAGGDCYAVAVGWLRPVQHWDATLRESLASGPGKDWPVHVGVSFSDVGRTSPFYRFVETLLHKGVTTGCASAEYCPLERVAREQMAVFVLTAREDAGYTPPACAAPMFGDVPASSPYCRWIEELARRGVVGGCGGGNYCPLAPVTREQMSVFVLRTLDPEVDPPACTTPVFGDVPASSPFCRWVEELARRGVITGCGNGNFCPNLPVTREQMSVFLTLTFGLTLYGA